jgi:hypothetical protein
MRLFNRYSAPLLLLALAACTDEPLPTTPTKPEVPKPPPAVVGLYQIEVSGIGGSELRSSMAPLPSGPSMALTPAGAGIVFEQVSASTFSEGARGQDGHRYVTFTYRVRNGTGAPLNNLTMLLVERAGTVPGTALSELRRFDGTAASSAIAPRVVPTGAAVMGSDLETMHATYPDVLQVLTEAEVSAITKPADVTNIFPVGYVVRRVDTNATRTLPAASDANQFDGVLTLSFRVPLQATSASDVFSFFFQVLAVTDSETRLTETIEEGQDTAAVRRLRERATALGATTVTVLAGSPAASPAVADYPGQRQVCSVRTAGTAAAPATFITAPAAYTQLMMLRPGETLSACDAYFRGGTPGRPATNVPFALALTATDRYGNLKGSVTDTVRIESASGPPVTIGSGGALAGGQRIVSVSYTDYGNSLLKAMGRRVRGWQPVGVAGVTRTWTAGAGSTDWHTNGNWSPAAVPMSQDSVYVPAAAPMFPVLAANVSVMGVNVENAASLSLNAFNLTASADVMAGHFSGGINSTTGRLILAGTARQVQGILPRMRVTGTYSLVGNVNTRAPLEVSAGRLTDAAFRIQALSN